MTEQVRYLLHELNKEPFNKGFNLISFDALEPIQLLQLLNDVLGAIDPKQKIDVREEAPEQTAIRVFQMLRVLKYKPCADDMSGFRAGLVVGEKPILYPVLEWLLKKQAELKVRAYLARFLVKIDIPPEFLLDEVADLYHQYETLMEQFKDYHKQLQHLKGSGFGTGEIRKDIINMEDEREQLIKRIERLKRKVESQPNSQPMMAAARNLRMERDQEQKLATQRQEQKNATQHADHRIQRLQQQLRDIRQASVGATSEGLFQRLQEETRSNEYIVKERLPKEIDLKRKTVEELHKVVMEPAMGQSDLDELNQKIHDINAEINQLVEKRMRSNDPIEDKLSLFRQQAAIIAHKKEASAESLRESRDDFAKAEQEVDEKREQVKVTDGGEVLKGEDFKRYVNKLRSKSTVYKKKRQEIAELRAELGVLSRTEEILKGKDTTVRHELSVLESKKGVLGYHDTQEELEKVSAVKTDFDEVKGRTLEDISDMVRKLTMKINSRKSDLAPIVKELRPMRERVEEVTQERDAKKSAYDTCAAGLESNRSKLEQDVRALREEVTAEESRYHYLQCMTKFIHVHKQRVDDEMKAYTSSDPQERKRTFREVYTKKIQEQENLGKGLREKQKTVRDKHGPNMKQMKMWADIERLMEVKRSCLERSIRGEGGGAFVHHDLPTPTMVEEDRLVL